VAVLMKWTFSREGCFSHPEKVDHPCIVTPPLTKDQKSAVAIVMVKIDVLDLFSGIGGFSLGFDRAGMETAAFCEVDPFCRAVLRKHWPKVKVYDEVALMRGLSLSDIECGREANGDARPRLRPDWVVIENTGHTWRRWVPELRRLLWERGYASLPIRVQAADVGGPHKRSRIYLLAHSDSERLRELSWWWQWEGRKMAAQLAESRFGQPRPSRVDDGVSPELDKARRKALGNAVVPQITEIIGKAIMKMEEEWES
jgi:DNA (cytosine-5)-methyltransferase 1